MNDEIKRIDEFKGINEFKTIQDLLDKYMDGATSNEGDLPLRTPTDRCLGGPLPRQQANQTHPHPSPSHFVHVRCLL